MRGLRCPLPYVRAKAAVPSLAPGEALVVRFTDLEAPVDLGALAHDEGLELTRDGDAITLRRPLRPAAGPPPP